MYTFKSKNKVVFAHNGTLESTRVLSIDGDDAFIQLNNYDKIVIHHLINRKSEWMSSEDKFVPHLYLALRNAHLRKNKRKPNIYIASEAEGYVSEVGKHVLQGSDALEGYDFKYNPSGLDGRMVIRFPDYPSLELVLLLKGQSYFLKDNGVDVTGRLHYHVKQLLGDMQKLFRDIAVKSSVRPYSELVAHLAVLEATYNEDRAFFDGEKAYYLGKIKAVHDLLGIKPTSNARSKKKVSVPNG